MRTAHSAENSTLADHAYSVLRDRIVLLDIVPGEPVSESALTEEIGVGRTPLREALKRLEVDHLVVTFPRRGTFATNVDLTELAKISEMRKALVPLAARRAAANSGGAVVEQLGEALHDIEDMSAADDQRALIEFDLRVHRLINHATDSRHLEETLVRLDNHITRLWCLMLERLPVMSEHIREHADLLRATVSGDQATAEKLAAEHVQHFEELVRSVL